MTVFTLVSIKKGNGILTWLNQTVSLTAGFVSYCSSIIKSWSTPHCIFCSNASHILIPTCLHRRFSIKTLNSDPSIFIHGLEVLPWGKWTKAPSDRRTVVRVDCTISTEVNPPLPPPLPLPVCLCSHVKLTWWKTTDTSTSCQCWLTVTCQWVSTNPVCTFVKKKKVTHAGFSLKIL